MKTLWNDITMGQSEILDTWQDFSVYWSHARLKSVDEQVRLWQTSYMKKYPELLKKQIQDYEGENIKWRDIAKRIFPSFPCRIQLMRKARDNVLGIYDPIYRKASEKLKLDFDMIFVVYIGIGCGAGWATIYNEKPAVLLGLENIAEEKWHTKNKLEGMVSHEIGHLAHMKWRNEWTTFERTEAEHPIFRLYTEGFAQRCEHFILGKETWHLAQDTKWLPWCENNKGQLAKELLNRLEKKVSVNDFFGSWFSIKGKKQTGYFLGHAFIQELEKTHGLKEIALLDVKKIEKLGKKYLESTVAKAFNS